jgi:hypothetical protein
MRKHSIRGIAVLVALTTCLITNDAANAKIAETSSPALAYYYFAYIGNDFTEQGYLISSNWVSRGSSPGATCAQGADEVPCVIYACLLAGHNKVIDLLGFLNALGCGFVKAYVESPSNVVYYRPEP